MTSKWRQKDGLWILEVSYGPPVKIAPQEETGNCAIYFNGSCISYDGSIEAAKKHALDLLGLEVMALLHLLTDEIHVLLQRN